MSAHYENRLLSALGADSQKLLLARASEERLHLKTTLYAEYEMPRFAYFPLTAVASVVALTAQGESSEVGFIGCEGVVGAYHLLGPAPVPTRCFIQIEGRALRIPFADLRGAYESSLEVRTRMHEFLQADFLSVSQMAGCNQMHDLTQRLSRWLLMAFDRHKSDTLTVTQDILAEMVAARRTSITALTTELRRQKLISTTRGQLTILDRKGLEEITCDCYSVAQTLFSDLYKVARV